MEYVTKPMENLLLSEFSNYTSPITAFSVHPEGLNSAVGCEDGSIFIIDTKTGEIINECVADGHSGKINSLSYDFDGSKLLSASEDNTIICWDVHTGAKLGVCATHIRGVNFAYFTPPSSEKKLYAISCSTDMSLRAWNLLVTEQDEISFKELYFIDWIKSVPMKGAFTADGNILITGCRDGNVTLYDTRNITISVEEIFKFEAHDQCITALAYRSYDSLLLTGSADNIVKVYLKYIISYGVFH